MTDIILEKWKVGRHKHRLRVNRNGHLVVEWRDILVNGGVWVIAWDECRLQGHIPYFRRRTRGT